VRTPEHVNEYCSYLIILYKSGDVLVARLTHRLKRKRPISLPRHPVTSIFPNISVPGFGAALPSPEALSQLAMPQRFCFRERLSRKQFNFQA
jgi:hypothetical protein